jgi:hypothetical protein
MLVKPSYIGIPGPFIYLYWHSGPFIFLMMLAHLSFYIGIPDSFFSMMLAHLFWDKF